MVRLSVVCLLIAACLPCSPLRAQTFGRKAEEGKAAGEAPALPAAGAAGAAHPLMQALDTDGDGTLSAKEIRAATKALLKLDLNHDKQLTPDELLPAGGMGAGELFGGKGAEHGAAGDGGPPPGAAAGRGDAGAFGGLGGPAAGGFGNPAAMGAGNVGAGGVGGNAGRRGSFEQPPGSGLPLSANRIMGFDKNRDGRVTQDELPPQVWAAVQRFDVNRDGAVDPLELQKAAGGRRG